LVLKELEVAAELVSEQMESIYQQCSWLSDVSSFIKSWKGSEWEYDMPADEFEVRARSPGPKGKEGERRRGRKEMEEGWGEEGERKGGEERKWRRESKGRGGKEGKKGSGGGEGEEEERRGGGGRGGGGRGRRGKEGKKGNGRGKGGRRGEREGGGRK
jgi:hypothetical protein